jgi:hypothetical protein
MVAALIGLAMAAAAPTEAGIVDKLQEEAKKRAVKEAVKKVTDPNKGAKDEQENDEAYRPKAELVCKDLGLVWITPWNPKLWTLRKLPGWADYVLSISVEGDVESANLITASAKGLRRLGSSKKVLSVLLDQKITATGAAFQCNETLHFYKDPETGKSMIPESRCDQTPDICVKG